MIPLLIGSDSWSVGPAGSTATNLIRLVLLCVLAVTIGTLLVGATGTATRALRRGRR